MPRPLGSDYSQKVGDSVCLQTMRYQGLTLGSKDVTLRVPRGAMQLDILDTLRSLETNQFIDRLKVSSG